VSLTAYSIKDIVSAPSMADGFYINRMENIPRPANIVFPHIHTFYEILWIEEGTSNQLIDYKTFQINPHSVFFVSPGQTHLFEEWSRIKGVAIFFTEDFFASNQLNTSLLFELTFLDNLYSAPEIPLTTEQPNGLKGIVSLLFVEYSASTKSPEILAALLMIFLRKMQHFFIESSEGIYNPFYLTTFKRLSLLIEQHYKSSSDNKWYAKELNVSVQHLTTITKYISGKTINTLLLNRKLLEAKRLLTYSSLSISDIAYELGFEDTSYFSRFFKRESHLSPTNFRQESLKKYPTNK